MTTILSPSGGPVGPAGSVSAGETLITIVLDKSGSMQSLREATIAGFNGFKRDQVALGADARVSLSLFDWEASLICSAIPLSELADLTAKTYVPDGCTALYDAIGDAIAHTDGLIATAKVRPERVLFAVITDGEENSSQRFSQKQVFDMVRAHEDAGWTFVFLGANIDSYAASQNVGVQGARRSRDWVATDAEMRRNMQTLSAATTRWRTADATTACAPAREFFADEDEAPAADDSSGS